MDRCGHAGLMAAIAAGSIALGQSAPKLRELRRFVPIEGSGRFDSWPASFADVDLDGDLDTVLAGRLLLGDGSGVFALGLGLPLTSGSYRRQGVLTDVDGDGDADIVQSVHGHPRTLETWLNDGQAHFALAAPPYAFAGNAYLGAFDVGDIDGDGDVDVLVPRSDDLDFEPGVLFLNDGAGLFTATIPSVMHAAFWDHIAVDLADIDGDGDLDAFSYGDPSYNENPWGTPNQLVINVGGGTLVPLAGSLPPAMVGTQPAVVDVDGDADLDLWGDGARLFLNDGTNHFVDGSSGLPGWNDNTRLAAVGDLDGDGDVDGIVDRPVHGFSQTLLNDGSAHFGVVSGQWPSGLGLGALADVDGDGDRDLFHDDQVLFNRGDGRLAWPAATILDLPAVYSELVVEDLDQDEDQDFVAFGPFGVRAYTNLGNATFEPSQSTTFPVEYVIQAAFADLNSDGHRDLITDPTATSLRVFLGDGNGAFAPGPLAPGAGSAHGGVLAAGDLDRDGDVDLVAGAFPIEVWLNDGQARLRTLADAWPGSIGAAYVSLGDLDGDADLDAVACVYTDVVVLLNDGNARLTRQAVVASAPTHLLQPYLGDVDADGDIDFAVSNTSYPSLILLGLNDGAANFADGSNHLPQAVGSGWARALVDADQDADLDLVVHAYPDLLLFANDGQGTFANAGVLAQHPSSGGQVTFVDLDLDSDVDGLLTGAVVLANLTHHVAWRTPPRIGRELALELHGTPGEHFRLYGSLGRAHLPFPPEGTLLIDRSRIVVEASGVFDAEGSASVVRQIPDEPALAGLALYWQARVASPRRLTNLEITVLEDF